MGQSRPLFRLFLSFSHHKSITNWKKRRWSAWDSNPGPQDWRHRRNHGAMAATLPFLRVSSCTDMVHLPPYLPTPQYSILRTIWSYNCVPGWGWHDPSPPSVYLALSDVELYLHLQQGTCWGQWVTHLPLWSIRLVLSPSILCLTLAYRYGSSLASLSVLHVIWYLYMVVLRSGRDR